MREWDGNVLSGFFLLFYLVSSFLHLVEQRIEKPEEQ